MRQLIAVLALVVCLAGAAVAQESTGKISGTVTDQTGAVVPGTTITATSPTLPKGLEVASDAAGRYVLQALPVGTYTLTVAKTGFTTLRQQNVAVRIGSDITYNPKLAVSRVAETVEVSETAVSIDPTSSRTATNIGASEMESLAKAQRSFNALLAMAPGVRTEIKGGNAGMGGISVDGASGSENAYYIDGVEVSDVRRGSLRQQSAVPLEFIQEIQVKSAGFEAEYGGATGGVVNVATKGGSNDFHGRFELQFTNNQVNARDRGYWQRSAANADAAEFFAPKEDTYRIFYPGFALGGPLLKNRLFFYESYMPDVERTERIVPYAFISGNALSGPRQYIQERIRHYNLSRVDFQPTSKLQVYTSYIWSPARQKGNLPSRDARLAPPSNDVSVQGGFAPAQQYNAAANYMATSRLLFSARFGYKYLNDKLGNYGLSAAPWITYQNATSRAPNVPAEFAGANGFSNVSSTLYNQRDITTRKAVYLDGSWVVGRHTLKVGYSISRVGNDTNTDYTNGRFLIYWGDAFTRGSVTNQRGTYGYYSWEDGVRNTGQVHSSNQGMYFQDTWKIHPRVTINAGLRLENEYLPPYKAVVNGRKVANPVSFGWGDKLAPRLGGAWDIRGNGRWKLAGSFGYFYDVMKYEIARGSFGSDYWWSHVYKLDNPNVYLLSRTTPGALGAVISEYDNRTLPINAQGEIEGIDPGLKPYTSREYTFTLDHQVSSKLIATVRYSHKDLLKAIEDIGVLDATDSEVYLTGNPGFGETRDAKSVYGGKTPNGNWLVPKAVRQYDGLEFRVQGQLTKRLNVLGSYTYSRLYGNYSGTANSDESGRSDPGVSRAFDLPYYYFDASGSQKNAVGRLATDRPHEFKLYAYYDMKTKAGSTVFGLNQIGFSGTPDSTSVIYLSAPTFPNGRGDMGRTPFLTQSDVAISHTVKVSERASLRFEGNIRNLFNQATVISRTTQINRTSAISMTLLPLNKFFAGYKLSDFVYPGSKTPPYNPIYGLPSGDYRNGGGGYGATASSASAVSTPGFGGYQDARVLRLGVSVRF